MQIACPKCGAQNWLENQKQCIVCLTILRRCTDCANYNRARDYCGPLDYEVPRQQAEHPTLLSNSTNCRYYIHLARQEAA